MKNMKLRKIALVLTAVILLSWGFTALNGCSKDETVYKSGTILSVSGEARVHRGDGSLPAYKGLSLRHGDTLYTEADAVVTVSLDGDKYALIEPDSAVTFRLYENETENVALIMITKGAVYMEAEAPITEGVTLGVGTADLIAVGAGASYRVSRGDVSPKPAWVQAIRGTVSVTPTNGSEYAVTEGNECRVDRNADGSSVMAVESEPTDPYSLPDRYIALGSEGIFDAIGNMIPRPASSDLSLRRISVKKADGTELPLIPEFDNDIAGYTVETDSVATLTVTANHRRTTLEIQCHTAASVKTEGNEGKVIFSENERFHAVSVLVTAEDGSQVRFSVNIVPIDA